MKSSSSTSVENSNPRSWRVIYTRPRWEKKVDLLLRAQGIESYCPLKKEYHTWADRIKMVEMPLFSSYVFVYSNLKEDIQVRQTLGVINFILFQNRPAIVSSEEILRIKYLTDNYSEIEVVNINQLSPGDRVLIKNGALENKEGRVLKVQGKNILMALDNLGCIILAKVASKNTVLLNN